MRRTASARQFNIGGSLRHLPRADRRAVHLARTSGGLHDQCVQQRRLRPSIDTHGGVAPTGTCAVQNTVAVDCTANHVFWAHK